VSVATRLDDCLSIRAGHLWMEECDTVELAGRFGTPLYAVSEDQLRRNARRIGAAFAAGWPDGETALLPSLKANLSLALRAILNGEGLGCDTFGPGELHAALAAGTEPTGRVVVTLIYNRDGNVIQAQVDEATVHDERVESCITDHAYAWAMPKPTPPGVVTVSYPYSFAPEPAPSPAQ